MGTLIIAGGTLRSRRVSAPSGRAVRPTPARVKEALFSILSSQLEDARVLDLFAGSGALGFEAISRGAAHVTFVEAHRPTALAITATAREFGVSERCEVIAAPAERVATRLRERYDLIFADPPYDLPYPAAIFASLRAAGALDAETLVIYEHRASAAAPLDPTLAVVRSEHYGAVALAFLRAVA